MNFRDGFCAYEMRGNVIVETPDTGMANPNFSRDVSIPNDSSYWELQGYKGNLAVWVAKGFHWPEIAARMIMANHLMRIHHTRLFVLGIVSHEEQQELDFWHLHAE